MGKQQQEEESWAFPSRTFSPNAAFCHRGLPQKSHVPTSWEKSAFTPALSLRGRCQPLLAALNGSQVPGEPKQGTSGFIEPAQWPGAAINHVAVWAMKGARGGGRTAPTSPTCSGMASLPRGDLLLTPSSPKGPPSGMLVPPM